jgi:AcrR family transcriptional regulator
MAPTNSAPAGMKAATIPTAATMRRADLVRRRHYATITVRDIVRSADVSRSTFYEHFSGKDSLLASGITGLFSVLADTVVSDDTSRLEFVLTHFSENRVLAREIVTGPAQVRIATLLVSQMHARLKAGSRKRPGPLMLPTRLIATQLAGMILATLKEWLQRRVRMRLPDTGRRPASNSQRSARRNVRQESLSGLSSNS